MPAKVPISWIPAHPVYGAVSMRRYWQALDEARRPDDRYDIRSVLRPTDVRVPSGAIGSAMRLWSRQVAYPARLRLICRGRITHVLDHSWADMLPHVPMDSRKVVTVHDLIPLRFAGELTAAQRVRFRSWVGHVCDADAVITVSHHTKEEVMEYLGIPAERIHVVPNGVAPGAAVSDHPLAIPPAGDTLRLGSIGSAIQRKNLDILPAAFAQFTAKTGRRISLVRVGDPLPAALAAELRQVVGEKNLTELGRIDDSQLAGFYSSLDAVVFPSLYEGFGLPVLESLAWGTPVVCSNATSLPEVGGNEALYFDPQDPDELAARLVELAEHGMPDGWRERARARAGKFSWRSSLEGIYDVYDSLLE